MEEVKESFGSYSVIVFIECQHITQQKPQKRQLNLIAPGKAVDMTSTNQQPVPISIPKPIEKNDVSILSWNIHDGLDGCEGLKTEQEDFAKILSDCSVFCLQETKREINLPNYRCFNQLRNSSRSGGLCIGVHRSISENVKLMKTK